MLFKCFPNTQVESRLVCLNKELRQILSSRPTSLHNETWSQTNQNTDRNKSETKKGREEEREEEWKWGETKMKERK